MTDMQWTADQQKAIISKDGSVLVSAAAGSGKTAVLVERVIRILTDEANPCGADEILVVTFTKAAASQMKDKILKKLSSLIREDPNNSFLQKQKMLLAGAKISTIDSFCNDILKSNYHRTDLPRSGRLMDGSEKYSLMSDVYEDTIEEYYEKKDEVFNEFTGLYTSSGNDREFKEKMLMLYEFSQAYPFPDEWIKNIGEHFKANFPKMLSAVIREAKDTFSYLSHLTDMLLGILNEDEVAYASYGESVENDNGFFRQAYIKALECESNEDYDELMKFVLSHEFPKIGKKPRGYESEQINIVRTVRQEYTSANSKQKLRTLFCSTSEENEKDVDSIYPYMKAASDFLTCFSENFKKRKIENNCIDFSDILHAAINILTYKDHDNNVCKTDVAKQYAEKFKYILVDEYQDTNYAQDMLFEAVSRDKENLFFVGDVKQSIYGFRQAIPQLFIDKRIRYHESVDEGYPANIYLGRNFRSRRGITDWVNFVFSQIMTNETCNIDYAQKEMLVCGAPYPEKSGSDVEIDALDTGKIEGGSQSEKEAAFIAYRIEQLLKSKEKITTPQGEREIQKGDICILLRAISSKGNVYANALEERDISYVFDSNDSLFETAEIRTMLSLLKVIDNPLDDIAVMGIMMSPIFAFSADDVSRVRLEGGNKETLYKCACVCAENGDEKCERFLKSLAKFRLYSSVMSVDELIGRLIDETGYESIVLSMSNGEARRTDLYIFRDYAKSILANSVLGLSAFLRLIEKIRKNGSDIAPAPRSLSDNDAVRIMSIHKSKGLEFPVCIVAGCSSKLNFSDCSSSMIVDVDYGVGLVGRDNSRGIVYETVNHLALKSVKRRSLIKEEMRVLYVAMTRAKEKLIMCVNWNDIKNIHKRNFVSLTGERYSPYEALRATSYSEWILTCVMKHRAGKGLRKDMEFDSANVLPDDFLLDAFVVDSIPPYTKSDSESEREPASQEIVRLLEEKINYRYPYAQLNDVPSKMGASEGKEKLNTEFFASSRPAFLDKEGLTPAQRGTAMHLFMQYCDYLSAKEDLEKEIERLTSRNYLNDAQASSLDRKKLKMFFTSSLAQRMFSSDKLYREKRFLINMSAKELGLHVPEIAENENIIVQGMIDCAFEENGQIVVVDYKTDRVSSPEELRERYIHQLSIYKKAVEECFGKKVSGTVIYSFSLSQEISVFD